MRILIFGGNGMLGHQLLRSLQERHDVRVTVRGPLENYAHHGLFSPLNTIDRVDVLDDGRVQTILDDLQPDAVVNAAGVIKQRDAAQDAVGCLNVNARFPRRLSQLCRDRAVRLVQISTDCVFSGRRGGYVESDPIDAEDVYGLSKHLGELHEPPAVTLRTSIIGLELSEKRSLIEWFLGQCGMAKGFTQAIYSGVTTSELARVVEFVLTSQTDLHGLWHLASQPISKFDLLTEFSCRLGRDDITIIPDSDFHCDRSLDGSAFQQRTGYVVPSWGDMLGELADQTNKRERACRDAA